MSPHYSLVIPFHNEGGNVLPLVGRAVDVLSGLGKPYEVVLVNDGSTDETAAEVADAISRWPACRALDLPARLGQAGALLAGLRSARGCVILTMDGDGQDDPGDFPALLVPIEAGRLDLVCGWRVERNDSFLRRAASRIANRVRGAVLGDRVHDAGCQVRAMRRAVVGVLRPMELLQAFVPALAASAGLSVGELPVHHHPRLRGTSKYGFAELWWRPAAAMLQLRWDLWRHPAP
jgi:glycosyltransferase involved in cell wall biosynthesis